MPIFHTAILLYDKKHCAIPAIAQRPYTPYFGITNPQYDDRLFIELQVQYMKIPSSEHGENMLSTEIVFDIQNNFCTQHVLPMFCKKKSLW